MKKSVTKLALSVNLPAKALASVGRLALSVLFLTFLFSLFSFTFASPARAAGCNYPAPNPNKPPTDQQIMNAFNKCAIDANVYDDKIFNFNQISGTVDSLNTMILGSSALHPETNNVTAGHGALAATSNMVASLYTNPPASGVQYFAQTIQKFNPVQPAYAQTGGIGYTALQPVQKLWTVF